MVMVMVSGSVNTPLLKGHVLDFFKQNSVYPGDQLTLEKKHAFGPNSAQCTVGIFLAQWLVAFYLLHQTLT